MQYPPQQPPWPPQQQGQPPTWYPPDQGWTPPQPPPYGQQPYNRWQPPRQPWPQQYPPYYPPPANWLEMERRRAIATKSYTNKAVITLLLYMFFFVPGFIANLIYLAEAYETKELTGTDPDGWGCLWTMLVIALAPVLLLCLLFVLATAIHH